MPGVFNSTTHRYVGDNSTWHSDIYLIKTTDPVLGGEDGATNIPIKELTDRTEYLYSKLNTSLDVQSGTIIINNGNANPGGTRVIGDLEVRGQLSIRGIDDPVIDDGKDRGIKFIWHDGTSEKTGFFGFDRSSTSFKYIPDAIEADGVFSGSKGTLDAYIDWSNIQNIPAEVQSGGTTSVSYTDTTTDFAFCVVPKVSAKILPSMGTSSTYIMVKVPVTGSESISGSFNVDLVGLTRGETTRINVSFNMTNGTFDGLDGSIAVLTYESTTTTTPYMVLNAGDWNSEYFIKIYVDYNTIYTGSGEHVAASISNISLYPASSGVLPENFELFSFTLTNPSLTNHVTPKTIYYKGSMYWDGGMKIISTLSPSGSYPAGSVWFKY